jgi:phosphate-selective porin OprO and OprP
MFLLSYVFVKVRLRFYDLFCRKHRKIKTVMMLRRALHSNLIAFQVKFPVGLLLCILAVPAIAQDLTANKFGKGISIVAKDSSFNVKFSARIQSLYQGEFIPAAAKYADGFQIRRSRLKFDGFAYSPKFQYKIELAVANSDINGGGIPQSGNTANFVLDAYVKWNFIGNWSLWFGQAKLPGNRERVISSQALQLVDRSNVNARFNLDRDAGVQLHYNGKFYNLSGALSMGEGRNIIVENSGGHDYTLRAEYLPFGKFIDKGDYFGADLRREPSPKLSLGLTYDFNDGASRERGQLGEFLNVNRDMVTWWADAHFKYRGFSSLIEYAYRSTPAGPLVYDEVGDVVGAFYTGQGISAQAGYLFSNKMELAARYTVVIPETVTMRNQNRQTTLGLSRYFVDHSLKLQTDITLIEEQSRDNVIHYRLQVEVAL